ncbi:MAG: nucleotidyltransferase domain-containing protein, partial [Actinomycetota bacterium]|nr:nucleotidyltransferase domain-containing protein [Actinomycetota bacterium]
MVSDHTLRGRDLCRALSAVTDRWLSELFATSVEHPSGVALLAVGGYGRGELAPGSDLDLWLVHDGRDDVATVAQRLWYPVWDAGLDLGHAVRSVRQAVALAADDLDTATASLSLRHLAGDAALSAE